ncbi:MAG: DedA family protein [Rhodocyclales bacterium CG17_big_fil_post_rev_8_21_14_2_50_68_7]|nr:MAG: DedA family protein [Rhodocyclales bacterium CG17_big_fil_post_rev_8_21_14_2_50_68_7]
MFAASFLAATLLPGGSEALFFALVRLHPDQAAAALAAAGLGNTLGGMSTYAAARLLPNRPEKLAAVRRWGPAALVLSWAPIAGDALCAAAGWLRLPWLPCAAWMALGKFARYAVVLALAG